MIFASRGGAVIKFLTDWLSFLHGPTVIDKLLAFLTVLGALGLFVLLTQAAGGTKR